VVAARIASFRGDRPGDSFRGWLWGITKNKLREHFRKTTLGDAPAGGTAALERLKLLAAAVPDDSSALEDASSRAFIMRKAMQAVRAEFEETTWQAFWRSQSTSSRQPTSRPTWAFRWRPCGRRSTGCCGACGRNSRGCCSLVSVGSLGRRMIVVVWTQCWAGVDAV
jgi:hypothetical protein